MSQLDALQQTLDNLTKLVANIKSEDLNKPTPCPDWNVKQLINHMAGVNTMMSMALNKQSMPAGGGDVDLLGNDVSGGYAKSANNAIADWRKPGALDGTLKMPFGEMPAGMVFGINLGDQLLHTWDLNKALGRDATLPTEAASAVLGGLKNVLTDDLRGPGKPFGVAVSVPANASVTDQLVAWSGRNPNWKP